MSANWEKAWWGAAVFGAIAGLAAAIAVARLGLDKQGRHPGFPGAPEPAPASESAKFVGTWQADEIEFGTPIRITWQMQAHGISCYQFLTPQGASALSGTWQYSHGVIFESYSNGASGRGAVRWIDDNHFVLTILDNGVPAYVGVKRNYHRR